MEDRPLSPEQGTRMTLQEEADIFKTALMDFIQLVAEELQIIRLMNYMEKKLKHKQKQNIGL